MRKRISAGVYFVANKETKAKANRFFLLKRALQVNHHKQQTHQSKLLSTWMIIKKMTMMKMTARWNFFLELENTKKINSFLYFIEKMNSYLNEKINQINVEVNRIKNYLWRYSSEENEENYNALKNVMCKKKRFIYEEIFKLVDTCRIIKSGSKLITIEIDTEHNCELIDDLSKKSFMKKINQRRAEKKIGHGYVLGNLFATFKIDFL